ncbi:MAG: hypothetical protein QGH74_08585 [Candidatus Brocadiia bacterium]|nr:hypothetical protein [Candidatus Brocadiia bacterium]
MSDDGSAGMTQFDVEAECPACGAACSDSYIVCTQDDERFDFTEVGSAVGELTGQPLRKVRERVTRFHGVLAEALPPNQASSLVERLGSIGVPAFAVAEDEVPVVGQGLGPARIHGAWEDTLQVQVGAEVTPRPIPWAALHAGFCTRENTVEQTTFEIVHEFLPGKIYYPTVRKGIKPVPRPQHAPVECTLLTLDAAGEICRLRFAEADVRYSYLGSRAQSTRARNFAAFLTDVIHRRPDAFFPASTRAVAAGQPFKVAKVREEGDYGRHFRWVLCCIGAQSAERQ